jgi:hypothetical protein
MKNVIELTPSAQPRTRADIARANGSKSKGPTTPEGKAKSSKNALKHGFAAKINVLIAPDDSDAWQTHIDGYHASYLPTNYVESEFVAQLASISWRQSRLTGIETALIDLQLSLQDAKVNEYHPLCEDDSYCKLALAWQALARKPIPRQLPLDPNQALDPTLPPDGLDISSIELVRRYQVSLDRQFRNTLLNFRQYRKDFAPASAPPQVQATQEPRRPNVQSIAAPPNEPTNLATPQAEPTPQPAKDPERDAA